MSKPLVYVAGPITGDPWGCVRKATEAAATLDGLGLLAYLPQLSVLHEMVDPQPYEKWIEHGIAMVERCDGFVRLAGASPGADREQTHARILNLPRLIAHPDGLGMTPSGAVYSWRTEVLERTR